MSTGILGGSEWESLSTLMDITWERGKGKEVKGWTHFVLLLSEIQLTSVIWEDKAWITHMKKCKVLRLLKEQEEHLIQTLPHIQQVKFFELSLKETRVLPNGLECNFFIFLFFVIFDLFVPLKSSPPAAWNPALLLVPDTCIH